MFKRNDFKVVRFGANAHAVRDSLQPSISPVVTQKQNPDEGNERRVPFSSVFVCKTSLLSSDDAAPR
jgi:hypothetical protein